MTGAETFMARIVFQTDNKTCEVEDGTALIECSDELDISLAFGCTEGTCGVCEVMVLKGIENCSKLTAEEKDFLLPEDIENGMRLGCQLKIKRGEVVLAWRKNRAR
jgi:ferredoxin